VAGQDPAIQTNFDTRLDGRLLAGHGEKKWNETSYLISFHVVPLHYIA
jgi:hypothetical protein